MEIFLIRLLQFLLAISLLVLLHELGHFGFSKLFGVRVDKFYLFFNPWFSLFKYKPKGSDTEYGVGWLPLGGYCKIAGMVDESFDKEQLAKEAQPWEFRSHPAWQRLLIMVGGVLVNFLTALFIYSMVLYHWGDTYYALEDMSQGMKFNTEAKALGFRDHDIITSTDNGPLKSFGPELYRELSTARTAYVKRGGKEVAIPLPGDLNLLDMLKSEPKFAAPFMPSDVDSVMPGSPAEGIGLAKGDRILAVNGNPVDSYNEFADQLGRLADEMTAAASPADSLRIRRATVVFAKPGSETPDTAEVTLTPDLKLGFVPQSYITMYEPRTVRYGFLESFPAGASYGCEVLSGYVRDMKYVFTSDGAKSLGGFGAIGGLFPPVWDWHMFWLMTAFLSIILAFMNILPIPALDGGHVLFLLYEIVARRKPSERFMVVAEYIGIGLLMLLMVVANLNDILRWLGYM